MAWPITRTGRTWVCKTKQHAESLSWLNIEYQNHYKLSSSEAAKGSTCWKCCFTVGSRRKNGNHELSGEKLGVHQWNQGTTARNVDAGRNSLEV
ncbi:hypothetical protein NL676_000358 [Syzygium grande]|nr:hypothetical protein NL676_000358 [Syzygium grande]